MPHLTTPLRICPQVYIVYAEYPHVDSGNVYLITGRRPTLIDCGSERAAPRLLDNLSQLGMQVTGLAHVLATHGDFDHVQGFHALRGRNPDLKLHIHRDDLDIVQEHTTYGNASYLYGQPFVPIERDHCVTLDDGDTIEAGDGALAVIHSPGHTAGSTCYLGDFDGHSLLFAGDTIGGAMRSLNGATLELWAQAMVTWERSLHRLAGQRFDWVLNGHEPAGTLPLARAHFDRLLPHFGTMLNPWFLRDDEEVTAAPRP